MWIDAKGEKDWFMVFHMDNCSLISYSKEKPIPPQPHIS
jgi:hypothetical protein